MFFFQADLITHLKEHNARLGEKLMILSAQLQHARVQQRLQSQQSVPQQQQPPQPQPSSQGVLQHSQEQLPPSRDTIAPSIGGIVEVHPEPSQNRNQEA